jgi:hypothetical protein
MPAKLFPWLSQVERAVRRKVDQPADEPGQPTWALEEWWQAFNASHRFIWERISSMDRNFGINIDDTLTAQAGAQTTALPGDLRVLRKVFAMDAARTCEQAVIRTASFDELGGWCAGEAAVYRPTENDLYWAKAPKQDIPLRVVYSANPPALPHGCIRKFTSGTNLTLASYESDDDLDYVDLGTDGLYLAEGRGCGAMPTPTAYDGCTKVLTINAGVTVDDTTKYTSRPKLPVDAYDAYLYDVCARLVEKTQDERWNEFVAEREAKLRAMATALSSLDRQETLYTRDDMEMGSHGDPIHDWY